MVRMLLAWVDVRLPGHKVRFAGNGLLTDIKIAQRWVRDTRAFEKEAPLEFFECPLNL